MELDTLTVDKYQDEVAWGTGMLKTACWKFLANRWNMVIDKDEMLMIGDASGKQGQFSDSDKKTAENYGIDYMDIDDFVNVKE